MRYWLVKRVERYHCAKCWKNYQSECVYRWEDLDLILLHQAYTITPFLGAHNEISDTA